MRSRAVIRYVRAPDVLVAASLAKHAKNELELAGLFDEESDYGGAIGKEVTDKARRGVNVISKAFGKLLKKHGFSLKSKDKWSAGPHPQEEAFSFVWNNPSEKFDVKVILRMGTTEYGDAEHTLELMI